MALTDFRDLFPAASSIHMTEKLFSEKALVALWANHTLRWTRQLYRLVVNLESPHVMTRPLVSPDDCSYGLHCRPSPDESATPVCCFGLAIDILKEVVERQRDYAAKVDICRERGQHLTQLQVYVKSSKIESRRQNETLAEYIHRFEQNDIISDLQAGRADIAVGSQAFIASALTNRSLVTEAYFSSTIGILISKREAEDKYAAFTAFLAPFDSRVWLLIVVAVHVSAVSTVIYEWKSPYGLTPNGRNRSKIYSFPSALTLCWSVLTSHTVATKSPKCSSCRVLVSVYAFFCLIIIASYTANLAACMVGEKSLRMRSINSLSDLKIQSGQYRVGAVLGSGTELYIRRALPQLYRYMALMDSAEEAFKQLQLGDIDVFVHDTESLMYFKRAFHLNDFDLVGKPFSHVSYGIAVSHNLKKEGKELRDCLSGILTQETFVQENHLRTKLWTIEVPGRDMAGSLKSWILNTTNFIGPLMLFCCGIALGILTLILEFIVYFICIPCCGKMKDKSVFLPISQRLYRHFYTIPNYNKHTFTERYWKDIEKPIAERLSNSRRESGIDLVDVSRLLSNATFETNIDSSTRTAISMETVTPSAPPMSLMYHPVTVHASASAPLLNNAALSFFQKDSNLHNIAVQTEVEAYVSDRLAPVDMTIAVRAREIEADLREMRERIADLLRDKEHLLRKLAPYEGRHDRNRMENEFLIEDAPMPVFHCRKKFG